MTNATATTRKKRSPAKPRRQEAPEGTPHTTPVDNPPEPAPEPKIEEKVYATADLLGEDQEWEETQLPRLGVWVKCRYLSTAEVTMLQFLPDYMGFIEMALASQLGKLEEVETAPGKLAADTTKYQAHVAHLAIVDPEADFTVDEECSDCDLKHPKSLWSLKQTNRLPASDMDHITATALRAAGVMKLAPFSEVPPESDSDEPVSSGESTPPTNS